MDLVLSTLDLREVVAMTPISPLPGRPPGIQGVVIYQGEFLPVLAWEDIPGCPSSKLPPMTMAVLRPRLAIPLERMIGMIDLSTGTNQDANENDLTVTWTGGRVRMGALDFRVLDPDRLIALLRRFRGER